MPLQIGIILGSNSDIPLDLALQKTSIETSYGLIPLWESDPALPVQIGVLLRHGSGHALLPHQVNYKGNFQALHTWGARAIISFTVVGVLQPDLPLARPILFHDVFFPSNQFPDGTACTLFDKPAHPDRGHLLVDQPLSPKLRQVLCPLLPDPIPEGIYGHAFGPRFSTQIELTYLTSLGLTAISQTSGPEFVLAGELGIPYALIGFGVDYATPDPKGRSSVKELNENLNQWSVTLPKILKAILHGAWPESLPFDQGYFYRIESDLPVNKVDY
jgi:5'-methylthioadenosine phosphorylase